MNKNAEHDVAFIRALAELLYQTDLTELEVVREYGENDELQVRLSRATAQPAAMPVPAPVAQVPQAASPPPIPVAETPAPAAGSKPDLAKALTSPMVGTAYLSSEPGGAPFVKVGDTVTEGQTVLIIEAMKTMNQIPSPRAGTVRQILVDNAEPVEFGHPLMIID